MVWVVWAVWVVWVEWECNTLFVPTKFKKASFYSPFFLLLLKICDEQSDEQVMNNFKTILEVLNSKMIHTTELYKKGVTIQDIATSMNTSERMIMSVYLGLSDQTLVERHKRVYGNMKIIK